MLDENRIKYYVPADYNENSKLEQLVKNIIDRTISNEILEEFHFNCIEEKNNETKNQDEKEKQKEELINSLEESMNFVNTHKVIGKLSEYKDWTEEQKTKLIRTALKNNQVTYILKDQDVRSFYELICKGTNNDDANKIMELLNSKE